MRALIKWPGAILLLIAFILCASALALLPVSSRLRRVFLTRNTSVFSRIMLRLLGVRIHVKHREHLHEGKPGRLVVANHVSYIDVFVISAITPSVFITSVELGDTPLLGMLARLGGSIFVERRKATRLKQEIPLIARMLRTGISVVLFPEGTTSNGDRIQPFKTSLFTAAVAAGSDILPLCLRYTGVNAAPPTSDTRDSVFYYGGTSFFRHFPRLLYLSSIDVEVLPLKMIGVQGDASRKELASRAHQVLSAAYDAASSRSCGNSPFSRDT